MSSFEGLSMEELKAQLLTERTRADGLEQLVRVVFEPLAYQ
jgi:hypothetical protein